MATPKRYRFLFVGGTIERKGIDVLLKAYSQVFSDHDDVCLVIKDMGVGTFYQDQTADTLIRQVTQRPHAPAIEYLKEDLTDDLMLDLYAACDCLVHPFRGEGFGLPIVEAMACGLPVIVTGCGPTLDYCDSETGYLIPARIVPLENLSADLATVAPPFWAEPDQDSLRYFLRRVVECPAEARAKGRKARAWIGSHFTWDHTVQRVEQRFEELAQRSIRRCRPNPRVVARHN